jgi:adenine phosphoribosyltransferase
MTQDRRASGARTPTNMSARLVAAIRDVPDFPKPGVVFKDITPLLTDGALFADVVSALAEPWRASRITHVLGIEGRGFIFGAPVAMLLGAGFVPARKPQRLPHRFITERYELEYGEGELQIHEDAFALPAAFVDALPDERTARVLVVDDLLATGGTARAALNLVKRLGAEPVGLSAVVDLAFLPWRSVLAGTHVETLVRFS